jgi:hypothetical protein
MQNSTLKHANGEILNLEASADVFIRRSAWNLAWDSGVDIFLLIHNLRAISYSIVIDNTTLIVSTPGEFCGVSHVIID